MEELFGEFEFNEAPEQLLSAVNGLPLPEDYLAFMQVHNGGEGPIGKNAYGRFYKLEELQEINDEYHAAGLWPGYVILGGIDGQHWAYCPAKRIYCQIDPYGTGEEETFYTISDSLEAFLIRMDQELEESPV